MLRPRIFAGVANVACQSVRTYLASYQLTHDVADSTIQQYGYAVTALCRWAGREVSLDELTDDLMNRWIESRRQAGIRGEWGNARPTIRGQAAAIKTLWLSAFEDGIVTVRPMRVKRIKLAVPIPEAWELSQFEDLIAATDHLSGYFECGVRRRSMLRALSMTAYYSGLRPCDVLALPKDTIGSDGTLIVRQQKTGEPIMCRLPPDAMAAIEAMGKFEGARLFPLRKKTLRYWFLKMLAIAKLKGTPKWIRRTGATQIEISHPGAAQAFLGHRTPGLAWRHYIDRRQVQNRKPMPPPLAG